MKNVFALKNKDTKKFLSGFWFETSQKNLVRLSWGENENECHFVDSWLEADKLSKSFLDKQFEFEIIELKYNVALEKFELA